MVLVFSSCKTIKTHDQIKFEDGVYISDNPYRSNLAFKGKNFYFFDVNPNLPYCCDTISKGTFELDQNNRLLYLTSYGYINSFFLKPEVVEEKAGPHDSLVFEISNPLEGYYANISFPKPVAPGIYYRIMIYSNSGSVNSIYTKKFGTNQIVIPRPNNLKIDSFNVALLPDYNFFRVRHITFREMQTHYYKVKNNYSNYFKVNIPDFDISYLSYRRLYKDIIRIVSPGQLEWDGDNYFLKK